MKPTKIDGQNGLLEPTWPNLLQIPSHEFEQSYAVAQLAARLCDIKIAQSKVPLEKENADPKNFLPKAWELIQSAREHVLRPQTDEEFLVQNQGTKGLAILLERKDRASRISFKKLCDPNRSKGDTKTILGVSWKLYHSEAGFDDLFWRYWQDIGDRWKNGDQEIGTMLEFDTKGKRRRIDFYSEKERKGMRFRARLTSRRRGWKARGQVLLNFWKQEGLPPSDFLALAEFRRTHDKRAANLKISEAQGSTQQRNGRTSGQKQ